MSIRKREEKVSNLFGLMWKRVGSQFCGGHYKLPIINGKVAVYTVEVCFKVNKYKKK
jgi:hypothetical protein